MKMNKLTLVTAIGSVLLSAQALGADLYVEGSLANSSLEDESDTGFGLNVGYNLYHENNLKVAVEANYTDYASLEFSEDGFDSSLDVSGVGIGTKVGYALSDQFDVFTRIGYETFTTEVTVDGGIFGDISASTDSQEMTFALGADYAVSEAITVGGQYKMATIEDELDLSSLSLTVGYQF